MIQGETYTVHIGSNLDILPTLPDNSVDSIVTDPPYGLSDNKYIDKTLVRWISGERDFVPDGKGFMGKSWDSFVPPPALWDECLRVLKPGGHLLAFFGSRTQDIGALSIRLAGFEIRDSIAWMYGSGFPKSLDVSKAIDRAAGAEREVLTETVEDLFGEREEKKEKPASGIGENGPAFSGHAEGAMQRETGDPVTEQAQQWEGWGTALKPAHEPIVVARKPLIGTVAETVLEHGTGGLNIDGSRIPSSDVLPEMSGKAVLGGSSEGWDRPWKNDPQAVKAREQRAKEAIKKTNQLGRWPANVILDKYTAEILDGQSGVSKPKAARTGLKGGNKGALGEFGGSSADAIGHWPEDSGGGASRFFYVAKASKRDRNEGLEELEPTRHSDRENADGVGGDNPRNRTNEARQNFHPTVKPTDLMRYLVKLVTPPGGTVLDPFTGSGSTGKAAILEGFRFIGCELTEDYIPIIEGRLAHAERLAAELKEKEDEALF